MVQVPEVCREDAKGACKGDVEEVQDSLAAFGSLAGYEAGGARRCDSSLC